MNSKPLSVSVIIPCRNERAHIVSCLTSVFAQDLDRIGFFEVVVADGCSDDGTRDILEKFRPGEPRLKVIDNSSLIVSAGLNYAIRAANGDIIIRMDAHTKYAPDYVRSCVSVLAASGADCVGGPWTAVGEGYVGTAIGAAFQSAFAIGGARGHSIGYEGIVDTVYLGCWRKETLLRAGLFDESMVRNQDDELSLRIIRNGGRIWQSPSIRSLYSVRSSLSGLFRQYIQYGYWKIAVIRKHKVPAAARHLAPAAFLLWIGCAWMPALFWPFFIFVYLIPLGLWFFMTIFASIGCAARIGGRYLPVLPIILATFHIAYGLGFLLGAFDAFFGRSGRKAMATLTRQPSHFKGGQ